MTSTNRISIATRSISRASARRPPTHRCCKCGATSIRRQPYRAVKCGCVPASNTNMKPVKVKPFHGGWDDNLIMAIGSEKL